MSSILIVEDDENLRLALHDNLQEEGYEVESAADGAAAIEQVGARSFDLIVLDIMLPDSDGYTLCKKFRGDGVKSMILMLTARTLEDDLIRGLDAGADDYLTKPYRLRELMARVRALLRRQNEAPVKELVCGPYRIDTERRETVHEDGSELELTRKEFDLLSFLVRNQGKALTRNQILDEVWGQDVVVDDRTVDNFISNLKKKLRWTPDSTFKIHTVRGVGYRLES
jgi:DNA-binding response OmpR family regulator